MKYDLATYVWPSYTGDEIRTRIFWPEGMGEWEIVKNRMSQKPLWGYVNEADPKVMEMQIEQAIKYGVNVFIYDWYWYDNRPFLENCLNEGFLKARNCNKMKFYIMWANHHATYLWDVRNSHVNNVLWQATVDFNQYKQIVDRWADLYFSKKNYYTINNKAVVSIFEIQNFIDSFGSLKNIKKAVNYLDDKCKSCGYSGVHLQFVKKNDNNYVIENKEYTFEQMIDIMPINSFTHYQISGFVKKEQDFKDIYPEVANEYVKMLNISKKTNKIYFPHMSVGWNDQPRFNIYRESIRNCDKKSIKKGLEMSKEYADDNKLKLITINSWNEWTEDSYLQPDDKRGYDYLQAIKEVFNNK